MIIFFRKRHCVSGIVMSFVFSALLAPLISSAQHSNNDFPYSVNKGVIYSKKGIPQVNWFADSRLAFRFEETGIAQVDYYYPDHNQNLPTLFLQQLWDGFRYFIEKNGKTYKPEYLNNRIWPFGLESEWGFEEAVFKHRVMAIDESIVIQIIVPDNIPSGLKFKMEFFESFALSKGSRDDLRFYTGETVRHWDRWKFSPALNILEGGFISMEEGAKTDANKESSRKRCLVGADFEMEHIVRPINFKHILKSPPLEGGKTYSFCVSFGEEPAMAYNKNKKLLDSLSRSTQQQFERYQKIADNSPVLKSPYPDLNNFISLAPMYHESLKIPGYPGALRAKTSNYWVWGWDGMTNNYATAYWGDAAHIKNMLQLYEATADSVKGIGHAFAYDMIPSSIGALPSQGMYITLLQMYYANTGDIECVKDRYPFAKLIFNMIAKNEIAGTGLCDGSSLFPDFPEAMSETGNDISGFNNTIFYCAARSMESLAALTGDSEQQKTALGIIRRFENNFLPKFFNKEKKFPVSSIDAITLDQRDSYNTNSIRWENNYCADITDAINKASLRFFKDNAVTPMGLREIPLWNKSYDMDANQLHCWWPATGEYFMRLINSNNERPLVEQWVKWVSYWTKNLTCPEGISYYIETDEPEFDRWTSQKGTWQGYSARSWYQAAIHGIVGVGVDIGGLTFYPYSGEEMTLEGLSYLNRKFDIEMKGSGGYIESIEADGEKIEGTCKLPIDVYKNKQRIKLTVNRVSINPYPVNIVSGTAIELQDYRYANGKITAKLTGAGLCRLKLNSNRLPKVKVAGKKVPVKYDPVSHIAQVELNLRPGSGQQIEIQ